MNFAMKMPPNHHFMLNGLPLEPVSRTYQYRKIMKPMLERKRRARINKCLDELKDLMTGTLQADGENVSKLEKADILELTVRHLHRLRESNALFLRRNETISMDKFWAGFQHCAAEVSQFLNKYDCNMSGDLIKYIANYIPNIAATATATATASMAVANAAAASAMTTASREQERLQAYVNQFPLGVNKPKPVKYDTIAQEPQCRQTTSINGRMRLHPYARNTVSTDGTLSEGDGYGDGDGYGYGDCDGDCDGDSDGESNGVWRPW